MSKNEGLFESRKVCSIHLDNSKQSLAGMTLLSTGSAFCKKSHSVAQIEEHKCGVNKHHICVRALIAQVEIHSPQPPYEGKRRGRH